MEVCAVPTILSGVVFIVLLAGWGMLWRLAGQSYRVQAMMKVPHLKLTTIAPPLLYVIDRIHLIERYPLLIHRIQRSIQILYGSSNTFMYTSLFVAEILHYAYFLLLFSVAMPMLMDGEWTGFFVIGLFVVLLPVMKIKELNNRVIRREQDILLELPEFLNQVILLVNAGETVQKALTHCIARKSEQVDHPLYKEMTQMVHEWSSGYSFQQSFEQFNKRCAVQEVSIFATTVMLNYRRGGEEFVVALRELSRVLWDKRKAVSRIRGEEASSKLVFPMVMVFFILLMLVCTPIFLLMNA